MSRRAGGRAPRPLAGDRDFRLYWSAAAVSGTGSAISIVVLPIFAVAALGASTAQMALLGAAGLLPSLLFQLPAAMWADANRSHLRTLVGCRVLAGVLAAMLPVLWWLDALTFERMLALVALEALVGVLASAHTAPVLVAIVRREHLVAASGSLNGTRSATDMVGQGLGAVLLAVASAPFALLVDAASYVAGAVLTRPIRVPEPGPGPDGERPAVAPRLRLAGVVSRAAIAQVAGIGRRLGARVDVWCLAAIALVNGISEAVFVVFAIRTLHVAPSSLGLFLAAGAVGGVVGGFSASRVAARFGRWTIVVGLVATVASIAPLAFVGAGIGATLAIVNFELVGALGGTVVISTVFGRIQAAAADDGTVARTMAIAQSVLQVAALVGLAAGALLAGWLTARAAMATGAVLLVALSVPLAVAVAGRRGDEPAPTPGPADDVEPSLVAGAGR